MRRNEIVWPPAGAEPANRSVAGDAGKVFLQIRNDIREMKPDLIDDSQDFPGFVELASAIRLSAK